MTFSVCKKGKNHQIIRTRKQNFILHGQSRCFSCRNRTYMHLKSHIQHYLQKPTDLHHQRPNRVHIYPRVLVVSVLYQLLFGSPKHSPTVTGLYPLLVKPFNIYSTSTCEVWLWISWLMTRKSFVVGEDTFRAVSNMFSELMIRMGESLR